MPRVFQVFFKSFSWSLFLIFHPRNNVSIRLWRKTEFIGIIPYINFLIKENLSGGEMRIEHVQEKVTYIFFHDNPTYVDSRWGIYMGIRPTCHFAASTESSLDTYRIIAQSAFRFTIPRGSPVIRSGYLFSDTGEWTRLRRE